MRFELEFKIGIFPLSNSNSILQLTQAGSRFHASKPASIKDHSSLSRYSRIRLPATRLGMSPLYQILLNPSSYSFNSEPTLDAQSLATGAYLRHIP